MTCGRWAGSPSVRRVLAALFLIVALATLAMPGSANFVGEFLILTGVLKAKIVFAILAGVGVALAAVYTIRLYQRSMHNPVGEAVESREMSVRRRLRARSDRRSRSSSSPSTRSSFSTARRRASPRACNRLSRSRSDEDLQPRYPVIQLAALNAPDIDYAGLSPIIALTGGACVTLIARALPRPPRARARRRLALLTLAAAIGPLDLAARREQDDRRRRAAQSTISG